MTLAEYINELMGRSEQPISYTFLNKELLKLITPRLLTFPEFKNVKKINVLNGPTYIHKFVKDGRDAIEMRDTVIMKLKDGVPNNFAEEIDMWMIDTSPTIHEPLSNSDLPMGLSISPTFYNPDTFTPYRVITIKSSIVEAEVDHIGLLDDVEKALKGELNTTYPEKYTVMVRVSTRSILPFEEKVSDMISNINTES